MVYNYNDDDERVSEDVGGAWAESKGSWTDSEEGISFYFVVFLSLLALVLVLAKLLHDRPKLASLLPEAGMTTLIGIVAGFFIYLFVPDVDNDAQNNDDANDSVAEGLLAFSPTVFFVALLPPIIFNSGYNLKRKLFFRHLDPIVLFACVGTAVSAIVVASLLHLVTWYGLTGSFQPSFTELLTFGALISATDPVSTLAVFQAKRVDPQLFYLVFGESVINDAVGLVLFTALSKFVGDENNVETVLVGVLKFAVDFILSFLGSFCLGLITGIGAALLLKTIDMRSTGLLELSVYVLIMYLPFLLAEILELSGIVTILFTGISAKRYCEPNLSPTTEIEADILFRVTAHLAEISIFLELGLSVFGLSGGGNFQWRFILWALLACLVGRAANIYPITFFFNRSLTGKDETRDVEMTPCRANDDEEDALGEKFDVSSPRRNEKPTLKTVLSDITMTPTSRKDLKIGSNTAAMLWFSGLRGAVAYACAKTFPDSYGNRTPFVVTTMVIVLVTVFFLGGTTEIALDALHIDMDVDEDKYMENNSERLGNGFLQRFEKKYVYPCVIRDYDPNREDGSVGPQEDDGRQPSLLSLSPQSTASYMGQHVEMTEAGHLSIMSQMGVWGQKKKESLYDYGFG